MISTICKKISPYLLIPRLGVNDDFDKNSILELERIPLPQDGELIFPLDDFIFEFLNLQGQKGN